MKPILFTTEEVRATLDNRKTVTRRVVKPQEKILENPMFGYTMFTPKGYISVRGDWTDTDGDKRYGENFIKLPYCHGDILYVREAWAEWHGRFVYKTTSFGSEKYIEKNGTESVIRWKSPVSMPREAARIFLRVTDVRVERLQEITFKQALKEGCNDYSSTALGFFYVWDSTLKAKDRILYGWEANPWVWVIEFERVSREEADCEQNKN